jgi:hypothetical protein
MRSAIFRVIALAIVSMAATVTGSCVDPVHDQEVDALGPETSGIPEGPFHRAGQPCLVCHGGIGPAKTKFGIAGTVFAGPVCKQGVNNAEVLLIDSIHTPEQLTTNCVGNFYFPDDPSFPTFPVAAWVAVPPTLRQMTSHIAREGSCGKCHADPPSASSPGHIFLNLTDPTSAPDSSSCTYPVSVPTTGCTNGVPTGGT